MQKPVTYGLLTSLCALLTSACADTEGERPGATYGLGGSAAQTAISGGSGGTPGTGGTGVIPAAGGTGSAAPAACSGCVELAVVPDGTYFQAQYLFRNGTTTYDLSAAKVIWRVRVITPATEIPGEQMFVTPFAQNNAPYPGVFRPQTTLTTAKGFDPTNENAWVDVTLDLANTAPVGVIVTPPVATPGDDAGTDAAAPPASSVQLDNAAGAFDKSQVFQYGLQVGVLATYIGTGSVHVAVDSVTYRTLDDQLIEALPDVTFDGTAQGLQLDTYNVPMGAQQPIVRP